ncbi:MAG: DNA recombination protein RmuC [Proteobacteria bacterium]|nr:DNA recombination protein RmuC [Pseudomonadota bacterium]
MDGNIAIIVGVAALALLIAGVLAGVVLSRRGGVLGRLSQLAEGQAAAQNQISERLQAQERALAKLLEERLTDVSKRLTEGLDQTTTRTVKTMTDIQKRLAVIDAAQKNIGELSAQMVSLQDILANKQARGAFGEIQLRDLVQNALPPSAYAFQAPIGDGKRVDCLLKLPNPPGPIAIDAKFPLESYHALRRGGDESARARAAKAFSDAILKHVRDIAEKYIVPGETAESALMFLPSEAVYAELHANFPGTVEKSYRARVWIVSPTTMMATLNTVRAVLKDARMREQADVIQAEVQIMMGDVGRLDNRVANLKKHFELASRDVGEIHTSAQKITKRGQRIEEIEVGEGAPEAGPVEELETPKPRVISASGK